ncbi:MAG: hypothetical protein H0V44_09980 [Planctomycetes bacterium]|nr:hypothetical protein [Planctomycetota bacterium]
MSDYLILYGSVMGASLVVIAFQLGRHVERLKWLREQERRLLETADRHGGAGWVPQRLVVDRT